MQKEKCNIVIYYRREKAILKLLYLLPLVDMLNGYLIRNHGISGVGATCHLILIAALVFITYGHGKIRIGLYEKRLISLVIVFIVSGMVNSILINNFQPISLERVEKIVTTALTIVCLNRLVSTKRITGKQLDNLLYYICVIVSVVTMFANLTGLGNYTYESSQLGRTGFFTGSNEPIAIYIILNSFLLYKYRMTFKNSYLLLILAFEINLIYAQSKSSYLFAAFFAIIMVGIIIYSIAKKGKIRKSILLIGLPGVAIGMFVGKKLLLQTLANFWNRQVFMKTAYSNTGFLNYISSGRAGRIYNLIGNIFNQRSLVMLFQLLFGQGLNFKYAEIIEIDVLDILLYGGLIDTLIVVIFMISFFCRIKRQSHLAALLTLVIYFFSFTAGHIWTGGISGTYFALVIVYFMYCRMESSCNS